jgi:PhnB protein
MSKPVLPPGYHTVTPSFIVPDLGRVLTFLEQTFGAKVVDRYDGPDGKIMHAEIMIVNCGEPTEKWGPMPCIMTVYVDEPAKVDALYQKALDVGGKSDVEPTNQFYGHRTATVIDPGGNKWSIAAIMETISSEEAHRRLDEMMKQASAPAAAPSAN